MTLHDMIDIIETSSKENAYLLIEAESNAVTRFKMRDLFFKAIKELNDHYDMPKDDWRE